MLRLARASTRRFVPVSQPIHGFPIAGPQRRFASPQFTLYRPLSTAQYHELADKALESITESFENLIEEKPEIDVDLSQGVLTLAMPPVGTYVINKQPPNMQIWLSSPLSGPKRYDYDEAAAKWVYDRDDSTLGELLRRETKDTYGLDLDLALK